MHQHIVPAFDNETELRSVVVSKDTVDVSIHPEQLNSEDCPVCSHHYSVFVEPDLICEPLSIHLFVCAPSEHYANNYINSNRVITPNKGPPVC